jgi:hypothetical protein
MLTNTVARQIGGYACVLMLGAHQMIKFLHLYGQARPRIFMRDHCRGQRLDLPPTERSSSGPANSP